MIARIVLCVSITVWSAGAAAQSPARDYETRWLDTGDENGVALRFESPEPTRLHVVRAGSHYFDRSCAAPCELRLDTGPQRLALSIEGHDPIEREIEIPGPGRLTGHYVNNRGLRAAGWTIFVLGILNSGAAATAGILLWWPELVHRWEFMTSLLVTAGLNFLMALCAGIPMIAAGDGAVLRFD